MLHRIHEDNLHMRSQIESYAKADTELRSSRFRLQQVLESIEAGFIAFELPGIVFNLNQRAAELLGTDRDSVLDKNIHTLFSSSQSNSEIIAALDAWENGEDEPDSSDSRTEHNVTSLSLDVEIIFP